MLNAKTVTNFEFGEGRYSRSRNQKGGRGKKNDSTPSYPRDVTVSRKKNLCEGKLYQAVTSFSKGPFLDRYRSQRLPRRRVGRKHKRRAGIQWGEVAKEAHELTCIGVFSAAEQHGSGLVLWWARILHIGGKFPRFISTKDEL